MDARLPGIVGKEGVTGRTEREVVPGEKRTLPGSDVVIGWKASFLVRIREETGLTHLD